MLVDAMNRDDIRVPHRRQRPRLAQQCFELRLVSLGPRQQDLQPDVALQMRVPRAVDLAKAALAHQLQQPEAAPGTPLCNSFRPALARPFRPGLPPPCQRTNWGQRSSLPEEIPSKVLKV